MMSCKNGVCQVIKARVTIGTLIALTGRLRVIKATLNDLFGLTRWAVDAVWPAQIAYRLITLNIIDQILDIDLHRWTPVRGWDMGWHQCTPYSNSTTLESNMSVRWNVKKSMTWSALPPDLPWEERLTGSSRCYIPTNHDTLRPRGYAEVPGC